MGEKGTSGTRHAGGRFINLITLPPDLRRWLACVRLLGWDGEGFEPDELAAVRGWLRAKANSIEGGTSEVNLNVVSKRVLGLPDPK